MIVSTFVALSVCFVAIACQSTASQGYPCPFLGPTYLKPSNLTKDLSINAAAGNTTSAILDALAAGLLDNQTTAFSLTAFSTSDDDSTLFYTFHQTPQVLTNAPLGVKKVTSNTVYRIGSLSKVVTVYALLLADGFKHFYDPISTFIPALLQQQTSRGSIESTDWEDITLQALASHMGGVGVEYGASDIAISPIPYTEVGLPEVPQQNLPPCGGPLGSPLCTRQQFVKGFAQKHPVFPPFHSPGYSNAAFELLALATEAITGQEFPQILQTKVFSALNMTRSSYDKPSDDLGVIPGDPTLFFWNVSIGDLTPGGGLYASPLDLAKFGRAVLSSRQLTPSQTRRWMKPVSHSSDPFTSVGAPWEIIRYTLPSSPYKTVDLYTKSGALGYYTAYLILVPDYNVGFTVNAAGSLGVVGPLANIITESFLPALEEAARLQTDAKYAGRYESLDKQYSFILSTDQHLPGLHLTNFTGPEDSDLFATLAFLASAAAAHYDVTEALLPLFQNGSAYAAYKAGLFGIEISLRLYPTMLQDEVKENNGTRRVSFRAAAGVSDGSQPGPFTAPCTTWLVVDTIVLGGNSFDEFIFDVDGQGNAIALNYGFLRETFVRSQ